MALTLNATAGSSSANSYATLASASDYLQQNIHTYTAWSSLSTANAEACLIWATTLLDKQMDWNGVKAEDSQGLRWPRESVSDPDGYAAQAMRSSTLGCEGKWAIHPGQIALATEVFDPPKAEIARAKKILKAMKQAQAQGLGAVSLDGRMIDAASVRQAEVLVAKAKLIAGATSSKKKSTKPKAKKAKAKSKKR